MHVTDRIKRARGCGTWDLLRSLLVLFWGETARVGRPTPIQSLCLKPLNACTIYRRGSTSLRGMGKNFQPLASYCTYSFSRCSVELRDANTNCVSSDP